jgi:ATP-dependent exoDNAse (exonuclease V) beta subunit
MRAWLSRQRYSFEQAQQGAEAVLQMLRHALTMPQARWVLEAHDEAEAEYTLEQVLDDGQVKRWIIDRTFVVQGERWIIDYKTDRLATGQSPQQLAESYREQLENYARLFAHQSLPIRMGVLLLSVPEFVEL